MGRLSVCQAWMRSPLTSTTVTSYCGHLAAIIAIVGPPTWPPPMQRMRLANRGISDDDCSSEEQRRRARHVRVGTEVARRVRRAHPVAVARVRRQARVVERRAPHPRDLGKGRAARALAA